MSQPPTSDTGHGHVLHDVPLLDGNQIRFEEPLSQFKKFNLAAQLIYHELLRLPTGVGPDHIPHVRESALVGIGVGDAIKAVNGRLDGGLAVDAS